MKRYVRSVSKRFAVREAWSGLSELQDEEAWSPPGTAFSGAPETSTGLASGPSPRPAIAQDPAGSRSVSRLATLLPSGAFERVDAAGPAPSGNFGRRAPSLFEPEGEPWPASEGTTSTSASVRDAIDLAAELRSAAFERPATPQGPDPLRARFGAAFEAALPARSGLRAVARCARTWIGRAHACGAEATAIDGWCGSPLCTACAGGHAAAAATSARASWDERVIVARVTLGPGPDLPAADAVIAARANWTFAAARAGVEELPRSIVIAGGLAIYARIPAGTDEGRALTRLIEGARAAGLRITTRVATRAEAADDLASAIESEASAFSRDVADDLARDGGAKTAAAWVTRVQARHGDGRRQVIFGGKGALPVDAKHPLAIRPASCPAHGERCATTAVIVRDGDGAPAHHPATALDKATRQSIGRLAD